MKVVIVGAGLGGLACAISCRKYGIDEVLVLERAAKIEPVSVDHHLPQSVSNMILKTTQHLDVLSNHTSNSRSELAFRFPPMRRGL
jgi:salicylate hydroxylase